MDIKSKDFIVLIIFFHPTCKDIENALEISKKFNIFCFWNSNRIASELDSFSFFSDENAGLSKAYNYALNKFSESWILILDQDSRLDLNSIEALRKAAANTKDIMAICPINSSKRGLFSVISDEKYGFEWAISSGTVINRRLALNIGGYNENYFVDKVDYEFWWRASNYGYNPTVLSEVIMPHFYGLECNEAGKEYNLDRKIGQIFSRMRFIKDYYIYLFFKRLYQR
jgi:rhamnosyltransferase